MVGFGSVRGLKGGEGGEGWVGMGGGTTHFYRLLNPAKPLDYHP